MAKKLGTVWNLEPHTAAKHAILRRYLQAWLPIMARYHGRIVYVDGFAGPGGYSGGEPGSPVIALQTAIEQQEFLKQEVVFWFIEEDESRLASLQAAISELQVPSRFLVTAVNGDCNALLQNLLDGMARDAESLAPSFMFLDPFGFSDTPLSLIRRIMAHDRCEVLITFMFEEINRFLTHDKLPTHFDALFGTEEWREALSQASPGDRRRFLKELYQRQLQLAADIRYVLAFEMRNQNDSLDYILLFGTNSIDGLMKMKESMWKVDQTTGFTFSDATHPGQEILFGSVPDARDIRSRITSRFAGQAVPVDAVERFVLESTPYRETHYKKVLKALERETRLAIISAKEDRKRGTFPPGTVIRFQ